MLPWLHNKRDLTENLLKLKLFDGFNLLCGVQSLGAGMGTVHDSVATIQLELVIYGVQTLLCVLIPAVLYPPTRQSKPSAPKNMSKQNHTRSRIWVLRNMEQHRRNPERKNRCKAFTNCSCSSKTSIVTIHHSLVLLSINCRLLTEVQISCNIDSTRTKPQYRYWQMWDMFPGPHFIKLDAEFTGIWVHNKK